MAVAGNAAAAAAACIVCKHAGHHDHMRPH